MAYSLSQPDNVNVLLSNTNWPWPQAVNQIFQPHRINALMAESPAQMVQIVHDNKIHLAILDNTMDDLGGLRTLQLIRSQDNLLPCLLLTNVIDNRLLTSALKLNVFSVLSKPVNMLQLQDQVDRLFRKYYSSNMFAQNNNAPVEPGEKPVEPTKTVVRWTIRLKRRKSL